MAAFVGLLASDDDVSNPWGKWFWNDWASDAGLRVSSLAAQGLWMRMLCVAATADPLGYVLIAGRPVTATDLALLTGAPEAQIDELWQELDRNGVFSRDRQGRIYNRRMVRDAKMRRDAKRFGKKGGNPALSPSNGKDEEKPPTLKGSLNGGVPPRSQEPVPKEDPREKVQGIVSHAARGRGPSGSSWSGDEKRKAWAGKIANEICRRHEPDRAATIIEAYDRGEGWAKAEFERVDKILKANRGAA